MIPKWRNFLLFGNSKAGHSSVQMGHSLNRLCSRVHLEELLCAQTTKFFLTPAYACLFIALRTEDVENSLAVVCSSTDDTPALVPLRQIVLNKKEDEIEEVMKEEVNKFLKVRFFNSQGNEADLSLKTNIYEGTTRNAGTGILSTLTNV